MRVALKVAGLEFHGGGRRLLGPVDMALDDPGITVVMGPNGAGKSLFLSALHGLLPDHGGTVTWNGQDAAATRARRGFVFQTTPVLRRSVAANIAFPLVARGVPSAERAARVARALTEARLTDAAHKPAATLSGGERRRLDLARATVTDPEVILLDEPSANLDPASTAELEAALGQIAEGGVKVILSTHDIAQARRIAATILFFSEGKLAEQGPAEAFFAAPSSDAARRYLAGQL
jgi:tungstate transport system ATP-binding protein